jgi:hypothetical protein
MAAKPAARKKFLFLSNIAALFTSSVPEAALHLNQIAPPQPEITSVIVTHESH